MLIDLQPPESAPAPAASQRRAAGEQRADPPGAGAPDDNLFFYLSSSAAPPASDDVGLECPLSPELGGAAAAPSATQGPSVGAPAPREPPQIAGFMSRRRGAAAELHAVEPGVATKALLCSLRVDDKHAAACVSANLSDREIGLEAVRRLPEGPLSEVGQAPSAPISAERPKLWMTARVQDRTPDMASAFARAGGSLLAATVDGAIDIGVSGAFSSAVFMASDQREQSEQRELLLGLDPGFYHVHGRGAERAVLVPSRASINATLTLGAVTSSGAACEANAGFGTCSLAEVIRCGTGLVAMAYDEWPAQVGSVSLRDVQFWEGSQEDAGHGFALPARVVEDDEWPNLLPPGTRPPLASRAALEGASEKFNNFLTEAALLRRADLPDELRADYPRAPRVYKALPGLHKSITSAPTGHTTIEAIMHAPTSLTADQLEVVLRAMTQVGLHEGLSSEQERAAADAVYLEATAAPGVAASAQARVAAAGIHLAIRTATDYHVDGAVGFGPNGGLRFEGAENWPFGPLRDFLKQGGDCDDSGTLFMRTVRQVGLAPFDMERYDAQGRFHSLDPAFDPLKHPWTRAARNALGFDYVAAFAIVGATTGSGSDVKNGELAPSTAAGHAVPLFLPVGDLIDAMGAGDAGDAAELQAAGREEALPEALRSEVGRRAAGIMRQAALMPANKLRALPAHQLGAQAGALGLQPEQSERELFGDTEMLRASAQRRGVRPLALDGTVTSEMTLTHPPERVDEMRAHAQRENAAADKMGPLMGSRRTDLTDIGPRVEGGYSHGFYLAGVELTVPNMSRALREIGAAASQFVIAPLDTQGGSVPGACGASPRDLDSGRFALHPMQRMCKGKAHAWDLILEETLAHAAPARDAAELGGQVTALEQRNAKALREELRKLNDLLRRREASYDADAPRGAFIELHISPRMIWGNPHAVRATLEKISMNALHGHVDLYEMDDLAPGATFAAVRFDVAE
jgi:hypothetical protein